MTEIDTCIRCILEFSVTISLGPLKSFTAKDIESPTIGIAQSVALHNILLLQ